MEKLEFLKGMKILSSAYFKDITESDLEVWYMLLKDFDTNIFYKTIDILIQNKKYMPSIAEIKEEYNNQTKNKKFYILEKMKEQGYFKDPIEYEKATHWLEEGVIPGWFKEDMKKYYTNKKEISGGNDEEYK